MSTSAFDERIRSVFGEFAIDKGLVRRLAGSGDDRHVPSYVMDWIVTRNAKSDQSTAAVEKSVQDFIAKHLPAKGEKETIRFKLARGETLTLLDAISVTVRLGREVQYFASIECLDERKALIDQSLIAQHEGLLQGSTWGAVKVCYDGSDEGGGIRIIDFKPMQTGRISLDVFRECRQAFTVEEWIDLLIRTLGYEPTMYGEPEKLWMLCRLIPVVQNRVNLMELAPPGSGKSYVYNNVSRHVWLTAGEITPAVLFYNRQSKAPGLLTRYDVLVLDEAQSLRFSNPAETQAQLKGYLEQGVYTRLQEIPNAHILSVKNIFREPGSYALVTEYADGGSLWDLMGADTDDEHRVALDERTAKAIAADILDGLAALHANDIVHRDIKPQNILRCDDVWKIADFGISKLLNNPVTGYTFQGAHTAPWAPPEQIEGAPAHPSADIYAWGRVTGFMLTGRTSKEALSSLPSPWRDIVGPCVEIVPTNRPDAGWVRERLEKLSV